MDFVKLLLDARTHAHVTPRPSQVVDEFDLAAAYRSAANTDAALCELGWEHAGRKLGFTNRATWAEFDLVTPIWSYVYDRTVIDASTTAEVPVSDLVAPRIEPEIVLGINERINVAGSEPDELAEAIDWVAPGFEIIDCHFAGWKFNAADIVADFGAHARLAIGPKVMVRDGDRGSLATVLAAVSVELRCGEVIIASGIGSNALGSPLYGLSFLCDTLADQNWADPLAAGEVITTGTLTDFPHIKRGERWTAEFAGAGLGALTINLI